MNVIIPDAVLSVNVVKCARCGQDHPELQFHKIMGSQITCEGLIFTHWAQCPTTIDPILLRVETILTLSDER